MSRETRYEESLVGMLIFFKLAIEIIIEIIYRLVFVPIGFLFEIFFGICSIILGAWPLALAAAAIYGIYRFFTG